MKYTWSVETVQQNGRFKLFSNKFYSSIYILFSLNMALRLAEFKKRSLTLVKSDWTTLNYKTIFATWIDMKSHFLDGGIKMRIQRRLEQNYPVNILIFMNVHCCKLVQLWAKSISIPYTDYISGGTSNLILKS